MKSITLPEKISFCFSPWELKVNHLPCKKYFSFSEKVNFISNIHQSLYFPNVSGDVKNVFFPIIKDNKLLLFTPQPNGEIREMILDDYSFFKKIYDVFSSNTYNNHNIISLLNSIKNYLLSNNDSGLQYFKYFLNQIGIDFCWSEKQTNIFKEFKQFWPELIQNAEVGSFDFYSKDITQIYTCILYKDENQVQQSFFIEFRELTQA